MPPGSAPRPRRILDPALVAGWEDADPFCSTLTSSEDGLRFCRGCPRTLVTKVLETGHAAGGSCVAGVRMLAFPAPRGSRSQVALLRVDAPKAPTAGRVAELVGVPATRIRRAAREAPGAEPAATLEAARTLRSPAGLQEWQISNRARAADRRRHATSALAEMIATTEEFHALLRASERQRAEIERSRRRLDRLAREAVHARDRERARIAHEIHDTATQSMVSAFRFLDAAQAFPADSPELRSFLKEASHRLLNAIREVRAVLAELVPPGLEELGLARATESRIREIAAEHNIGVIFDGDLPRLDDWVEQTLYGMTLEAVRNAVLHGKPSQVSIALRSIRGRAVVIVQDDGTGFDPRSIGPRGDGTGTGLLGISRRATWLGGRAVVRSRPEAGTTVRISIPIQSTRSSPKGAASHPPSAERETTPR